MTVRVLDIFKLSMVSRQGREQHRPGQGQMWVADLGPAQRLRLCTYWALLPYPSHKHKHSLCFSPHKAEMRVKGLQQRPVHSPSALITQARGQV